MREKITPAHIIIAIISTIIITLGILTAVEDKEFAEEVLNKSQTYSIYIDGILVDVDNIDLGLYDLDAISVDDDSEKIFITARKD